MASFDSVLNRVNERFNLGEKGAVLMGALIALINDGNRGGLAGFLRNFHRAGLGRVADSWVATGLNTPLSSQQLEDGLGAETLSNLAAQADLPTATAKSALALMIPQVVDEMTPEGFFAKSDAHAASKTTAGLPDRAGHSVGATTTGTNAETIVETIDDNSILRWILPLIILLLLVGIGFYTCRPNQPTRMMQPASNTAPGTHSNH